MTSAPAIRACRYLKRWRVDYLKIDRSFVRDLVTDMSDLAIVSAIIAMARHLNIKVVAEGIEGWQQLEKLRQLGCSLAQGFLFARPAPAADCLRYLTRLAGGSHAAPAGAGPAREHRQRRAAPGHPRLATASCAHGRACRSAFRNVREWAMASTVDTSSAPAPSARARC